MAVTHSENQLRMEFVSRTIDWENIISTIPDGSNKEDELKRREEILTNHKKC